MMQPNRNISSIGIEENQYKHLRTVNNERVSVKELSSTSEAIFYGILGGAGIAMFLIVAQLMVGNPLALKFLKFIALFGVIRYGLDAQDTDRQYNYDFTKGILFGIITTASIAVLLVLVNILLSWVFPSLAFDQLVMQAESLKQLVESSRGLFIETLVFGITITLIIMQSLKTKL